MNYDHCVKNGPTPSSNPHSNAPAMPSADVHRDAASIAVQKGQTHHPATPATRTNTK